MAEQGFFKSQRVELIDGEVVDMPPQKDTHVYVVSAVDRTLQKLFPHDQYWVRIQATLKVGDALPEPDAAVVAGPPRPGDSFPNAALLVIEVSDSTLAFDISDKASLYAQGGIEDYWVIDVSNRVLIVHRNPIQDPSARFGARYASVRKIMPGDQVAPAVLPDALIDPAQILP